jgi:hypothetical protein
MAAPKYDMEKLTNDVKTIITTYLNTKLSEIDSEKNDGITLTQLDTSAGIYLQELNGVSINADPFVVYGIVDIPKAEGIGTAVLKKYLIEVALVKEDTGEVGEVARLMFRYQRALEEIFEEHWTDNENSSKLIITSLVPRAIPLMNSSHQHRAVGLVLEVDLA